MAARPGRQAQDQPQDPEANYEVEEGKVLDAYADAFHINTSLYSATLYFGVSRPGKKDRLLARLKVSPPMLKALALLINKHRKEYEQAVGAINLPNQVVHDWGLEEEVK